MLGLGEVGVVGVLSAGGAGEIEREGLSGPASSGTRATPEDSTAAGRNRIHLIVNDLDAEIDRLRSAGLSFRSNLVSGPGGRQILLTDPAGNLIELFQPDYHWPRPARASATSGTKPPA